MDIYTEILKNVIAECRIFHMEKYLEKLIENNSSRELLKKVRLDLKVVKNDLIRGKKNIKDLRPQLKGGKLPAGIIREFFIASHDKVLQNVKDYEVDKEISNKYVRVYYNKNNDWTVVVHRGSGDLKDVFYDAQLVLGVTDNERFKISRETQSKAEKKYNPKRMTVLGSSFGGVLAEASSGKNVHEIITSGKPVTPKDLILNKKTKDNQFDVRTNADIISALKPFQSKNVNDITLKSLTPLNPIKSHIGSEVFSKKYFDEDTMVGRGPPEDIQRMKVEQLKNLIKITRKSKKLKAKDWKVSGIRKHELQKMAARILSK